MMAVGNRECSGEGKGVHENFLQEDTRTDKVKIDSSASCLVATRYTP